MLFSKNPHTLTSFYVWPLQESSPALAHSHRLLILRSWQYLCEVVKYIRPWIILPFKQSLISLPPEYLIIVPHSICPLSLFVIVTLDLYDRVVILLISKDYPI